MKPVKETDPHAQRSTFYEWGSRGYNESYGTMYREGDNVVFEHGDYDQEDGRLYQHYIEIPLDMFRHLIKEIKEKGTAQMHQELWSLYIGSAENKGRATLSGRFCSTPSPSTTPGGALLMQGILFEADMESVLKGIQ